MNINEIQKYVINLDSRQDRLEHIQSEFEYIGWKFNRFSAVDTGSYEGCALSHIALAEQALDSNLDYILVVEDDIFFMPYFHELLNDCLKDLESVDWDLFHLAPSIHRPLNYEFGNLVDLSADRPPKKENHRGIYGTSGFIYKKSIFDKFKHWHGCKKWKNPKLQKPFDVFFDEYIYYNYKCYCPKFPLVTQISDYSTINRGVYNNHYIMTYNWRAYINPEFPIKYFDQNACRKFRQ